MVRLTYFHHLLGYVLVDFPLIGLEIGLSSGTCHRIKVLPHNISDDSVLREQPVTMFKQKTAS